MSEGEREETAILLAQDAAGKVERVDPSKIYFFPAFTEEEVIERLGQCNTLQEAITALDEITEADKGYKKAGFRYDFNHFAWIAYKNGVLPYSVTEVRREVLKLKGRIDDLLNTDFREDSDKWKELLRG